MTMKAIIEKIVKIRPTPYGGKIDVDSQIITHLVSF